MASAAAGRRLAALLLLAPLLCLVRGQDALPPQCDPVTTLTPRSIAFLGPARSKQIGELCAATAAGQTPAARRPLLDSWSTLSPAGDIEYNYHLFGNTTGKPPLVMIMGMVSRCEVWGQRKGAVNEGWRVAAVG